MARRTMLTECPNCGSSWGPGSEEWQFQECDCCGYPDPSCKDFMREDDDEYADDYDDYPEGWPADEPDYDIEKNKS